MEAVYPVVASIVRLLFQRHNLPHLIHLHNWALHCTCLQLVCTEWCLHSGTARLRQKDLGMCCHCGGVQGVPKLWSIPTHQNHHRNSTHHCSVLKPRYTDHHCGT